MNEPTVVEQLLKYLSGTGWEKVMYPYLNSSEFEYIIQELQDNIKKDKRFVPSIEVAFRWMKECPFDQIKVVMMIDDDLNNLPSNQGIPLSSNNDKLRSMTDFNEKKIVGKYTLRSLVEYLTADTELFNYDLVHWCNQGVLMIPCALTQRLEGKPHYSIWKDFRARMVEIINEHYKAVPWVLVGEMTHDYEYLIDSKYTLPITLNPLTHNWTKWVDITLGNINKPTINWNNSDKINRKSIILRQIPVSILEQEEQEELSQSIKEKNELKESKAFTPNYTGIVQCDMDNKFIQIYSDANKAAKSVGTIATNIKQILSGIGKSCKGYKWYYETKLPKEFMDANPEYQPQILNSSVL